jgi:hypothetical protein
MLVDRPAQGEQLDARLLLQCGERRARLTWAE